MVISVQAEKPPVNVNSSPSLTVAEKPSVEIAAVDGKVPSSSPYGNDPCVLKFFPAERYLKVRVCGLFLKDLEQIKQSPSRGAREESPPLLPLLDLVLVLLAVFMVFAFLDLAVLDLADLDSIIECS